ncbi:hypothetical protein MRB53_038865 [Persea americana]|nr:hypothetical protein MRB53_038865 [Persea americana]
MAQDTAAQLTPTWLAEPRGISTHESEAEVPPGVELPMLPLLPLLGAMCLDRDDYQSFAGHDALCRQSLQTTVFVVVIGLRDRSWQQFSSLDEKKIAFCNVNRSKSGLLHRPAFVVTVQHSILYHSLGIQCRLSYSVFLQALYHSIIVGRRNMNSTLSPESDQGDYGYTTFFEPLTTTFTPPTQCYTLVTYSYGSYEVFGRPTDITSCLPTEASSTMIYVGYTPRSTLDSFNMLSKVSLSLYSRLRLTLIAATPAKSRASSDLYFAPQVCTSILPAGVPYDNVRSGLLTTATAYYAMTLSATGLSGWNIQHQFCACNLDKREI